MVSLVVQLAEASLKEGRYTEESAPPFDLCGRKALKLQLPLLVSLKPFSLLGTSTFFSFGRVGELFSSRTLPPFLGRPILWPFTLGSKLEMSFYSPENFTP